MDPLIIVLISAASCIVLSLVLGNIIASRKVRKKEQDARSKASLIIKEAEMQAENIKKDKILEAKEKFLKMKQEFEDEANRKKNLIISNEQKIKQREGQLAKEIEQVKRKEG